MISATSPTLSCSRTQTSPDLRTNPGQEQIRMSVFGPISRVAVIAVLSFLALGVAEAAEPAVIPPASTAIELGRFAVTCPGVSPAEDQKPLAYSFRVTMLAGAEDADEVRVNLPAYRDAVIVVAHGYCGFVARNARRADPQELSNLIGARAVADRAAPRVVFTLPDFIEKHLDPR
jgi:hypothetical protein